MPPIAGDMSESGTQFEPPSSRPNSADGKVMVPGKYTPAHKVGKASRLGPESSKQSSKSASLQQRSGMGAWDPADSGSPLRGQGTRAEHSGTRLPSLSSSLKPGQSPDPSPFLLPLQRTYAPNLLINHAKALRGTVRIAPAVDDSMNGGRPRAVSSMSQFGSMNESTMSETMRPRAASALGHGSASVSMATSPKHHGAQTTDVTAQPSIFGNSSSKQQNSHKAKSAGVKEVQKSKDAGKALALPAEELDTFLPSAKEMREAKELFRQFDTDGDGTLTMAEIQASLYFNNVDYEEIQAILGPNGVKGTGPGGAVSVEEFARFLCRRRRENANRQQSSQVSKHSRVARIYVSSCVHQHHSERKVLHERVFPKLEELCASMGGEIVPVDLRYKAGGECPQGENTAVGPMHLDAMAELTRAATDKNFLFLGLVADLPGECTLPSELSMAEFETLKASAKIIEAANDERGLPQALDALFVPNKNAVTQTYVLEPKNATEADIAMVLRAFAEQEGEDKQLHSSFTRVRSKIAKSLNEQEVAKCLSLGTELGQAERTFMYLRRIDDVPVEHLKTQVPGKSEDEIFADIDRQTIFSENIAERLSPGNVYKYAIPWSESSVKMHESSQFGQKAPCEIFDDGYLQKFETDVFNALCGPIMEMLSRPSDSVFDVELEAHTTLMRRNAALLYNFDSDPFAREIMEYIFGSKDRKEMEKQLADADAASDANKRKRIAADLEKKAAGNSPYIVSGETGMGKTALLAACAEKFSYSKEAGQCALIYRCIGATPLSADGRLLLDGLCEELARILGATRTRPRPSSWNNLLVEFLELLRMLSNKKTVVMFLDGLSELPDTDHAHRLSWLPAQLPAKTYIVASCRPNNPRAINKFPEANVKELKPVEEAEYNALIHHWLEKYKQGLQPNQIEDVINSAIEMSSDVAAFRAHLRLAFDEATNNIASFALPDKLSGITTKPGVLVYECLGLLCVSRGGLSESELRKLVNLEESCKATEALPHQRFHKVLQQLAPYLTTWESDDRMVMSLRHDSYKEIILNRAGFSDRIKEWNAMLAAFYAKQPSMYDNDLDAIKRNSRKLRVLVYYQLGAEMWAEACSTLCSIDYIQAMCEAGMSVHLQALFAHAIRVIPEQFRDAQSTFGLDTVQTFYRFLIRTMQALSPHSCMIEQPGLVIQMGANEPKGTLPEKQANEILIADGDSRVWLQAVNKAVHVSPLYATLVCQTVVRSSHISADGSIIATGSDDGDIQIWDAETGESVLILTGHNSAINSLKFVASTRRLVSASSDCTVRVWDESTATCLNVYTGHKAPILGLSASSDGIMVASGSEDSEVHLWNIDGTPLKQMMGHTAAVRACTFNQDATRLATASLDKTVRIWDVASGECLFVFEHVGRVYDVQFSSNSKKCISSSSFATCTVWDIESAKADNNEPEKTFKTGSGSCFSCNFVGLDKQLCMASEQGTVFFWDIDDTKSPILELKAHSEIVFRTSLSSGGDWLVTSGADKLTQVWNLQTISTNIELQKMKAKEAATETPQAPVGDIPVEEDAELLIEREHAMTGEDGLEDLLPLEDPVEQKEEGDMPDIVRSIAMSEDGLYGVSCSEFGSLMVWDIEKVEMVVRCKIPAVARVVKFVPGPLKDETCRFVAACDDGIIRVFDIAELLQHKTSLNASLDSESFSPCSEIGFHDFCIRSLKFCKDGQRFVTGSVDTSARLWNLNSISQEMCFEGHTDSVLDAEMSSNMHIVVTGSTDKTVRVWSAKTGKEQWVGKHGAYVYSVIFSPDCRRAISASADRTTRVWAAKNGDCLHILKGKSALLTAQISDMGQLLCTGYEGAMHFWDIRHFEQPAIEAVGHGAEIRSAGYSKYGNYCITASNDGSVRVFDARTGVSLGALPLPNPLHSMASVIDDDRAIAMCGDEQGQVFIVRVNGVRDASPQPQAIIEDSFLSVAAPAAKNR